mgnify:CR=1 FL=1
MKIVLFDLDGTIADSLLIAIETFNEMADFYRFESFQTDDLDEFRNMHFKDVLKNLHLMRYGILAPLLIWDFKRREGKKLKDGHPFPGMGRVLNELKDENYVVGLLTSNSKRNAKRFLKNHGLLDYFDFVRAEMNIFGKDKAIEKIMRRYEINKDEIVYVGDEARDVEACKKIDIPIISVDWGYNSTKIIVEHNPDYLATKPEEILDLVKIRWKED